MPDPSRGPAGTPSAGVSSASSEASLSRALVPVSRSALPDAFTRAARCEPFRGDGKRDLVEFFAEFDDFCASAGVRDGQRALALLTMLKGAASSFAHALPYEVRLDFTALKAALVKEYCAARAVRARSQLAGTTWNPDTHTFQQYCETTIRLMRQIHPQLDMISLGPFIAQQVWRGTPYAIKRYCASAITCDDLDRLKTDLVAAEAMYRERTKRYVTTPTGQKQVMRVDNEAYAAMDDDEDEECYERPAPTALPGAPPGLQQEQQAASQQQGLSATQLKEIIQDGFVNALQVSGFRPRNPNNAPGNGQGPRPRYDIHEECGRPHKPGLCWGKNFENKPAHFVPRNPQRNHDGNWKARSGDGQAKTETKQSAPPPAKETQPQALAITSTSAHGAPQFFMGTPVTAEQNARNYAPSSCGRIHNVAMDQQIPEAATLPDLTTLPDPDAHVVIMSTSIVGLPALREPRSGTSP